MDDLTLLWDQQRAFMDLLRAKRGFPDFPVDITSKTGQKLLNDIRHHLVDEVHEASQHLKNAKSHRVTEIPEIDRAAYLEELADVIHLYIELLIASGISKEEIVRAYLLKGEVNTSRIENGY